MIYAAKIDENGFVTQVQVISATMDLSDLGLIAIGPDNTVGVGWRFVGQRGFVPPVVDETDENLTV